MLRKKWTCEAEHETARLSGAIGSIRNIYLSTYFGCAVQLEPVMMNATNIHSRGPGCSLEDGSWQARAAACLVWSPSHEEQKLAVVPPRAPELPLFVKRAASLLPINCWMLCYSSLHYLLCSVARIGRAEKGHCCSTWTAVTVSRQACASRCQASRFAPGYHCHVES